MLIVLVTIVKFLNFIKFTQGFIAKLLFAVFIVTKMTLGSYHIRGLICDWFQVFKLWKNVTSQCTFLPAVEFNGADCKQSHVRKHCLRFLVSEPLKYPIFIVLILALLIRLWQGPILEPCLWCTHTENFTKGPKWDGWRERVEELFSGPWLTILLNVFRIYNQGNVAASPSLKFEL